MPSVVRPMDRLVPGAGPFRFLGGSAEVVFGSSGPGLGVELDSEGASVDSVTLTVGTQSVAGAGEGASDVCDDGSGLCRCFSSNCANRSDGRRNTTTFDGFLTLSELLVGVDGDLGVAMVLDMFVILIVDKVGIGGGCM